MWVEDLKTKKCIMVCGGGGVGKTTTAAAIGVAATQYRDRVLVVTIDPAKRLAEAFGFSVQELMEGGEPRRMDGDRLRALGVREGAQLAVGILNPKYVLQQIMDQVLSRPQRERLTQTVLYQQISQMIYGLQEYTAYEWVTRMLSSGQYDLIILDTPPAFHAKDFFNVPEKIKNLMESRVFQLFMPRRHGFLATLLGGALQFPWVERLLGAGIFSESRLFFETFNLLRDRILERCLWLAKFFQDREVAVMAVSTIETGAQAELEGLRRFLSEKNIQLSTVILNQIEQAPLSSPAWDAQLAEHGELLLKKWKELEQFQLDRAQRAQAQVMRAQASIEKPMEIITVPMIYSDDGLQILKRASQEMLRGN